MGTAEIGGDEEMNEPIRVAYTRDEMIQNARKFMDENYGKPHGDLWMTRFGLLIDFVSELFPEMKEGE